MNRAMANHEHKPASLPVADGLAQLLQQRRRAIDRACQRFVDSGDSESLHDLRVAIRRLHTLATVFSDALTLHSRFPAELRRLQKLTNPARDLEVSLALLRNRSLQQAWLEEAWQERLDNEYRQLRRSLPQRWHGIAPTLEQALRERSGQTLGGFAAERLLTTIRTLKKQLRPLCRRRDDLQAHKLRITGKRLRYLLEPFADELPEAAAAVAQTRCFQELLGDYHDIVVLHDKLKAIERHQSGKKRARLRRARKTLKARRKALYKQFATQHCGRAGKRLVQQLLAAQRALEKL